MMRPGRGRHHHDAGRKKHGLGDRVGDEDDGLPRLSPQLQKLLVQMVADDLVERAERLVHEQQLGSKHSARAIETRCCIPPESCQGNCFSKPCRLTSARYSPARAFRSSAEKPIDFERQHDVAHDGAPGIQRGRLEDIAVCALEPRFSGSRR